MIAIGIRKQMAKVGGKDEHLRLAGGAGGWRQWRWSWELGHSLYQVRGLKAPKGTLAGAVCSISRVERKRSQQRRADQGEGNAGKELCRHSLV